MNTALPMHLRELRAQMELKGISLRNVSELSGVHYTTCSEVLSHRRLSPSALDRISKAIRTAKPTPEPASR